MQQAPFEYPIASQMDSFLAVFNANRNVIRRTVECLTMLYADPEVYATWHFLSETNIIFVPDMPMTLHTLGIKCTIFFHLFLSTMIWSPQWV